MHLIEQLKTDKELNRAYEASIAMAFYDNANWYKKHTGKTTLSQQDVVIVGNLAAKHFLAMLTGNKEYLKQPLAQQIKNLKK